jgi:hypothetical protein
MIKYIKEHVKKFGNIGGLVIVAGAVIVTLLILYIGLFK